MNEKKIINARKAISIVTILTLFVAGFEVFMAYTQYKPGMTICDIASYVTKNRNLYCMILIIANLTLLPGAILLYKENNISLKDEIYDKRTLGRDIFYGILAEIVCEIIGFIYIVPNIGKTELANIGYEMGIGIKIMEVIALVFVSGICKEIYFRGLAKRFFGPVVGELPALILFNVLFSLLDWFNLGYSLLIGFVWIFAYRKTKHLITPMVAHGLGNLIFIIYTFFI